MTLVFDERERLGERPGVHALIAAVSRYSQLGVGRAAALSELELKFPAAVPTANRIRSWLQRAILPVPLATIRLLLSPPRRETSGARGVDSCTLEHFLEEAESWREDALRNRANVTWLYLAGCCLELTYDQIFLFEDFGIGPGALFRKAASIKNLVDGMAPMSDAREIARAQYYFIDARSTSVRELDPLQLQTTTPVFNVPWPSLDDRETAVYFGTTPPPTTRREPRQTAFGTALLKCLEEKAGEQADGRWRVTSVSLGQALRRELARSDPEGSGTDARQSAPPPMVTGSLRAGTICYLDRPPSAELEIELWPPAEQADAPVAKIEIRAETDDLVRTFEPPHKHMRVRSLPAGIYTATMVSPVGPLMRLIFNVAPPITKIQMRLPEGGTRRSPPDETGR
jgi:hypothetical protein